MKNRGLVSFLIGLWSNVYTYAGRKRVQDRRDSIHTRWLSHFLGSVGVNSLLHYPIKIEGGGINRIHIGSRTSIGSQCIIGCWVRYGERQTFNPEIRIGDDCNIGDFCQITAIKQITIGDGFLAGRFVYIGDNSHGGLSIEEASIPPAKRQLISKGEIVIGRNVWVCDRVSILSGVTIGDNVIIGAGTIVTHSIPSNCMVAGAPARIIKRLDICQNQE